MGAIIEARNITKLFYKDNVAIGAVEQASFKIEEGECLGVVGESGCGKTTLAYLLLNFLEPDEGELFFYGEKVSKCSEREKQKLYKAIQMVFQLPFSSFDPKKTIGSSVGESLIGLKKNEREKKVKNLLQMAELEANIAKRYPSQISGGQCQRAAIARALARQPKLLICDEITSALDVTVQAQIIELLKKLQREQKLSLFFICHDLALVQNFCDRVLVLQKGRIVEEGRADEIILHPKTEYTRLLIEAAF